jgi:UPF0755 protein
VAEDKIQQEVVVPPRKRRRLVWIGVAVFGAIVVASAASVGGALLYLESAFETPGPAVADGVATVFDVPPGQGLSEISARLEAEGLVTDGRFFRLGVAWNGAGRALKAGEYSIPSRASMAEIMELLRSGKVIQH